MRYYALHNTSHAQNQLSLASSPRPRRLMAAGPSTSSSSPSSIALQPKPPASPHRSHHFNHDRSTASANRTHHHPNPSRRHRTDDLTPVITNRCRCALRVLWSESCVLSRQTKSNCIGQYLLHLQYYVRNILRFVCVYSCMRYQYITHTSACTCLFVYVHVFCVCSRCVYLRMCASFYLSAVTASV